MPDQTSLFKWNVLSTYLCGAAAGVVAVWGMFVLENYFGISIHGHKLARDKLPMSIWFPGIATPIILIGAYFLYWRSIRFMTRAIRTTGTVVSIGTFEMHSMRDVVYSYEYEGTSFEVKRSISVVALDDLVVGGQVVVLVDRFSPRNSRLASEFTWALNGGEETQTGD